jgi:hypothetical protein
VANAWKTSKLKLLTIVWLRTSSFPHGIKSVSLHEKDCVACYTNAQSMMFAMQKALKIEQSQKHRTHRLINTFRPGQTPSSSKQNIKAEAIFFIFLLEASAADSSRPSIFSESRCW